MSYTNSTPNYNLPQWIGTDKPTFLGDFNNAFSAIDTQMKANADASTAATATANTAAATATSANTNATTALNTANSAASEAASATSAAASATSTANTASTNAAAALRASAANTIDNLAPAYDPTLTYNVGDLVTYIDDQNSGKLYKCIVAVSSPEAFNINKWDDVTTSEVYGTKSKLVATAAGDGAKSYGDVLDDLYSQNSIDITKEYLLVIHNETSSPYTNIVHTRAVNGTWYNFTDCGASTTNLLVSLYDINSTASKYIRNTVDANGFSSSDKTNDVVPATMTLSIYELGTE